MTAAGMRYAEMRKFMQRFSRYINSFQPWRRGLLLGNPSAPMATTSVRHSTNAAPDPTQAEQREVYGAMRQVKTSPMKLNLVAKLIRGMSVSDAIAQMEFSPKKAARFVLTTLLDTQRRAAESHNMEPLRLHIDNHLCFGTHKYITAESFVGKGHYLKRIRYHGKGMHGKMNKYYAHYFLKLREGPPPPKKTRRKEDHKRYKTRKLIEAGPRSIPNSL